MSGQLSVGCKLEAQTGTMQKKPRMNTNGRELQGRFGDLGTSM
jgi:hypothetical protein